MEFSVRCPSPPYAYSYVKKKFGFNKKIYTKSLIVYVSYQPNSCNTHAEHEWVRGTFLRQRRKFLPAHGQQVCEIIDCWLQIIQPCKCKGKGINGLVIRSFRWLVVDLQEEVRSPQEISKNLSGNFKNRKFLLVSKCWVTAYIFRVGILTLPHDKVFGHLWNSAVK